MAYTKKKMDINNVVGNEVYSADIRMVIRSFEYNGKKFMFKTPFYWLEYKYEHGYFTHENDKLGIIVSGKNLDELVAEFYEHFYCDWHAYAMEDDSKLSLDARKLKQDLLDMCEVR
jgi:hypothetical protein